MPFGPHAAVTSASNMAYINLALTQAQRSKSLPKSGASARTATSWGRVGRFLRRFSLDELPQLFNVLRGTMSLVGPRPPLQSEVDVYEDHARRRLLVTPGLTGLWQVNGRSLLSWEETVRLDEETTMSKIWDEREKSLENEYFRRKEQELIEQLRTKRADQERTDPADIENRTPAI